MPFKKYSALLKRRKPARMLGFTRERAILLGRFVQRCRRPSLVSIRQRIKRHSAFAPRAVKARLACTRSERKPAAEASRMGRLNLRLLFWNQCIEEENERLRKQAVVLSEENKVLRLKMQQHVRSTNAVVEC